MRMNKRLRFASGLFPVRRSPNQRIRRTGGYFLSMRRMLPFQQSPVRPTGLRSNIGAYVKAHSAGLQTQRRAFASYHRRFPSRVAEALIWRGSPIKWLPRSSRCLRRAGVWNAGASLLIYRASHPIKQRMQHRSPPLQKTQGWGSLGCL
jgi:hypothetical protein